LRVDFSIFAACYDLLEERTQVRNLLINLGHDPILSDHSDVYYDNFEHTHVSCIRQISNADMVILLIGNRYGGVAIDEAYKEINLDLIQERLNAKIKLKDLVSEMKERSISSSEAHEKDNTLKKIKYGFSITHFEILRAIQEDIPIYVFIKDKVWNFNELYTLNKDKIEDLNIPSIDKNHSKYLFEFIEILKNRKVGNSIQPYSNFLDIEKSLKKQLAEKLKTLMDDRKNLKNQSQQQQDYISKLTDRFDDLKEAILSVVPKGNEREVAKGVINFRRLIGSLSYMLNSIKVDKLQIVNIVSSSTISFDEILKTKINIQHTFSTDINEDLKSFFNTIYKPRVSFHRNTPKNLLVGNNFFFVIENLKLIDHLRNEWNDFIAINESVRKTIVDALTEDGIPEFLPSIYYVEDSIEHYSKTKMMELINSSDLSESTQTMIKYFKSYMKSKDEDNDQDLESYIKIS
jgi:hypothetical protein